MSTDPQRKNQHTQARGSTARAGFLDLVHGSRNAAGFPGAEADRQGPAAPVRFPRMSSINQCDVH